MIDVLKIEDFCLYLIPKSGYHCEFNELIFVKTSCLFFIVLSPKLKQLIIKAGLLDLGTLSVQKDS